MSTDHVVSHASECAETSIKDQVYRKTINIFMVLPCLQFPRWMQEYSIEGLKRTWQGHEHDEIDHGLDFHWFVSAIQSIWREKHGENNWNCGRDRDGARTCLHIQYKERQTKESKYESWRRRKVSSERRQKQIQQLSERMNEGWWREGVVISCMGVDICDDRLYRNNNWWGPEAKQCITRAKRR